MEMFLLGYAYLSLQNLQDFLSQGKHKEALSYVNDSLRQLNSKINKFFPEKEQLK